MKLRKANASQHDHRRGWLKLTDSGGALRKTQLLERVSFDNRILAIREDHPAPSFDASEALWKIFISAELQLIKLHNIDL